MDAHELNPIIVRRGKVNNLMMFFILIQSWMQYVMIREDTALTGLEKRYGIIFLTIRSIIMTVSKCL